MSADGSCPRSAKKAGASDASRNFLATIPSSPRSPPTEPSSIDDDSTQTSKIYQSTNISGSATAVVGDVINHVKNVNNVNNVSYFSGIGAQQIFDPRSSEPELFNPDSISDYDFQYAHWRRRQQRLAGTCQWIFEVKEYRDWIQESGPPILLCTGSVGCGKSITAAAVIDELMLSQTQPSRNVVSYFAEASNEYTTTAGRVVQALLKQLLCHYKDKFEYPSRDMMKAFQDAFVYRRALLSLALALPLVRLMIKETDECVFILDGIDILEEDEVLELIEFLREVFRDRIVRERNAKMLIFCRETLGRGISLESIGSSKLFRLSTAHLKADLHLYVEHQVDKKQSERGITSDANLLAKIKDVLKAQSAKMFLWIKLQVLTLWDPYCVTCPDDIIPQLGSLPRDLDETYIACLRRIEKTNQKRTREIALKVFKWVAFAKRSLTDVQAREAVSMTTQNLPLQASSILISPVTEYCANLVVVDEVTGLIAFPHPTVREFLRDASNLPADLGVYHLSAQEDDLWIGELCLEYAKVYQNRNQMVLHRTQELDSNVLKPIIRTALGRFMPSRTRSQAAAGKTVRLSLPSARDKKGLVGKDFSMHSYLCTHWLSHNRSISHDSSAYSTFVKLSLSHDPELQPWAIDTAIGSEHYQRLIGWAIQNEHTTLLSIVIEHLNKTRLSLIPEVLSAPCPGTDSTFLHIAAAVGNKDIVEALLKFRPKNIADEEGRSPAAVASIAHQKHVFELLAPRQHHRLFPDGSWKLYKVNGDVLRENLFFVCAAQGSPETLECLLDRFCRSSNPRLEVLSTALFHACQTGKKENMRLLKRAGADPNKYILVEGDYFPLRTVFSSIKRAWELGDPNVVENLREAGADFSFVP